MESLTLVKLNQNQQIVMNSQDIITGWLTNKDLHNVITDDISHINIYNQWCDHYDLDDKVTATPENNSIDYISTRTDISNWHMPDDYKELDIVRWLNNRELTHEQRERLHMEIEMFRERGMIPVLKFLRYLVDICEKNNVVLGVGRGSSVASYVLYLIGIHKIDSIKYNLDIKEFLK